MLASPSGKACAGRIAAHLSLGVDAPLACDSKHSVKSIMRHLRLLPACIAAAFVMSSPAWADPLKDASALIKQEKYAQASELLDKVLATKPKDAQARFLKGIALTELKKLDAAVGVFQQLTQDYPDLPEPYNNLAVIYAQQKQYDKAKQALETAIRTHPAYATAHENLGDIYARLASQAYGKALSLDAANASAQSKLALIQDLVGAPASRESRGNVTPTVAAATPAAAAPAPPALSAAPATQPPASPVGATRPSPAKPVATPPVAVAAAAPAATGAPSTPPAAAVVPTQAATADEAGAARAVRAWSSAWSKKDVGSYLAAYAPDFQVPDKRARGVWEAERRQRIEKPGKIDVALDNLHIRLDGETARAEFRQTYRAGTFVRKTTKRLDLVRRDGRWLIVRESVGG